jgi:hypothetical protein
VTIKDQLTNDIPKFFKTTEFAEEVTIRDKDGGSLATDVPANFIDGNFLDATPKKTKHPAKFFIPTSYHPNGVFAIGEKIEREEAPGVIYRIEKISMVEFGVAHIDARTDARSKF